MDFTAFLAIILLVNLVCAVVAAFLAARWGRDPFGWVIVCAVLGPFGLVALLALRPGSTTPIEPLTAGATTTGPGLKVLVPVDGSEYGVAAAQAASRSPQSRITLLAVLPRERGELPPDGESPRHREAEAEAREHFEAAATALRSAGVAFQEETVFGDAAEQIKKVAGDGGFDLIVMGRRGRGGLKKALLGSVSEKVVADAGVPVTVVGLRRVS